MSAVGILDENRGTSCRHPGGYIRVAVADHPGGREIELSKAAAASSEHSRERLADGASARKLRDDALQGGAGTPEGWNGAPSAERRAMTRSWTASRSASVAFPFAAAGWFDAPTSSQPAPASCFIAAAALLGSRLTSEARSGDSGMSDGGSPPDGPAPRHGRGRPPGGRSPGRSSGIQGLPMSTAHRERRMRRRPMPTTTASPNDSTSGVFRADGASTMMAMSASSASVPVGRSNHPVDRGPDRVPARSRSPG